MTFRYDAIVYVMLLAGAISLVVAVSSARRRRVPGAWPLVVINIGGAIWAFTTAFQLASSSFDTAFFFHRLSFVGMGVLGVAFFAFAAQYTGHDAWVTPKRVVALAILPAMTQVLVWTNQYHGLVYTVAFPACAMGLLADLQNDPGSVVVDRFHLHLLSDSGRHRRHDLSVRS